MTDAVNKEELLTVAEYGAAPPPITYSLETDRGKESEAGAVVNRGDEEPTVASVETSVPTLSFMTMSAFPPEAPVTTNSELFNPTEATVVLLLAMLYGGDPPETLYRELEPTPNTKLLGAEVNNAAADRTEIAVLTDAPKESLMVTEAWPPDLPVTEKVLPLNATVATATSLLTAV